MHSLKKGIHFQKLKKEISNRSMKAANINLYDQWTKAVFNVVVRALEVLVAHGVCVYMHYHFILKF